MCETHCAESDTRNGKELVRLSVVDGTTGGTLLDSLVRPRARIVDMRSTIHGVTAAHLEECAFELQHAQVRTALQESSSFAA